jgi:opacity protein-like surface antigen
MKNFLMIVLVICCTTLVYSGDPARKGTTGADQLLIPVGARGIATSGAFISNITGLESIYFNPAGLNSTQGSEAMFSYMNYIADINVSYFAIGTNLGAIGSIAFNIKTLDFGDIPITTADNPDGTGATFSPAFLTAGVTYSKVVTDRVSIGVNAKVISETIMNTSATGFALDFGVQYRFPNNLSIGATVKNIGTNMAYSGSDLQYRTDIPNANPGSPRGVSGAVTEEFQIPSYFELSTAYRYNINEMNNLIIGTAFRSNNVAEDQMKFGLEYGFNQMFFIRGGYDMMVENTNQSIYGLTFGAGLNYSLIDGMGLAFDYAYRDVKDFPTPNHIFTVKLMLQ